MSDPNPVPFAGYVIQPWIDPLESDVHQYRRAHPSFSQPAALDAVLGRELDSWAAAGVVAVAWHGNSVSLTPGRFGEYATLAKARGLASLAAFGMNSDDATGKARRIAAVAKHPLCLGVVLDPEGDFEDETHAAEAQHAGEFAREFRKLAGDRVWTTWQPWPVPTQHWSTYPWEEFAACVDAHSEQRYVNDWRRQWGTKRYAKCEAWFTESWAKMEDRLRRAGISPRPHVQTIEGYGWADIPADLEACIASHPSQFVWCEWRPDRDVLAAIANATQKRCATPQAA